MAMGDLDILKITEIVTKAQETMFQNLAQVRREALSDMQKMEETILGHFTSAHTENRRTMEKIEGQIKDTDKALNKHMEDDRAQFKEVMRWIYIAIGGIGVIVFLSNWLSNALFNEKEQSPKPVSSQSQLVEE